MRQILRAAIAPAALAVLAIQGTAAATPAGVVDYTVTNAVTLQALGRDIQSPTADQTITFGAKLVADSAKNLDELVFVIRDASDANFDVGDRDGYQLGTSQQTLTASRTLPAGTYRVWVAYRIGTTWTNLTPNPAQTFAVGSSGGGTNPGNENPPSGAQPNGGGSGWNLRWWDEFSGTSVDWGTKWRGHSSALADAGRGNKNNQQLEYNLDRNCSEANGVVTMTAKRERYTAPSGQVYDWTSCLLTSIGASGFTLKHGFIESRAKLTFNVVDAGGNPVADKRGFWPAFWTWQADGVNTWQETDVYEQYSDNPRKLYLTSHANAGGGCQVDLDFDPGADFHTYGAGISASGTTFYIDGRQVCSVAGTASENTNLIEDLYVYSRSGYQPVAATVSAQKAVDYVRVWQR
ncbi:glycoside hydrolase family 16 protein [Nonomuraea sp. NPDC004186]